MAKIEKRGFWNRVKETGAAKAAAVGIGILTGVPASGVIAKKGQEWISGPTVDTKELARLKTALENLQRRKEKTGGDPAKLFGDWFKDITTDPGRWILNNEPALKARIKSAEVHKEVGDYLDWFVFLVIFAFAFREIVPRITKRAYKYLEGKAERKKDEAVVDAINEHDEKIERLVKKIEEQERVLRAMADVALQNTEAGAEPSPESAEKLGEYLLEALKTYRELDVSLPPQTKE
jgi:hypothetical protein